MCSRGRCSSALLDGPPASRDHQRMDPTVRELVLLALLSAFLCGVALIYAEPIATAVFAALTSGCVVIAAGLSLGSWTWRLARFAQRSGSPHEAVET
jgi:hypothetical protein